MLCKYCGHIGKITDFEVDHDPPKARIATVLGLMQQTITYICSGCNRQKGTMTEQEYHLWRILHPTEANYGPVR